MEQRQKNIMEHMQKAQEAMELRDELKFAYNQKEMNNSVQFNIRWWRLITNVAYKKRLMMDETNKFSQDLSWNWEKNYYTIEDCTVHFKPEVWRLHHKPAWHPAVQHFWMYWLIHWKCSSLKSGRITEVFNNSV